MNSAAILVLCVVFACCNSTPTGKDEKNKELYSDEFDNVDITEILNNKRLFNYHLECFRTGKGCSAQAQRVRDLMPEILKTGCARCTETQKRKGRVVADFILEKHPDLFLEFETKHDPERTYRKKYADRIKQEGIVLPN